MVLGEAQQGYGYDDGAWMLNVARTLSRKRVLKEHPCREISAHDDYMETPNYDIEQALGRYAASSGKNVLGVIRDIYWIGQMQVHVWKGSEATHLVQDVRVSPLSLKRATHPCTHGHYSHSLSVLTSLSCLPALSSRTAPLPSTSLLSFSPHRPPSHYFSVLLVLLSLLTQPLHRRSLAVQCHQSCNLASPRRRVARNTPSGSRSLFSVASG
ncbi:hypothetical protein PIB30_062341 [Stylosanthes scabra]|uniref:Uncharacterized protein n=1 Tax=Stylosanthes scabra TaxID=79078 RepID=A0ABU6WJI3_9FABA|nr:hypothetical protein [Stylosanthes scabra]